MTGQFQCKTNTKKSLIILTDPSDWLLFPSTTFDQSFRVFQSKPFSLSSSVTGFGEISALWRNFINLWPFIEANDSILNLFWQNIYVIGDCCKWPNIEHVISRLVTLQSPLVRATCFTGSETRPRYLPRRPPRGCSPHAIYFLDPRILGQQKREGAKVAWNSQSLEKESHKKKKSPWQRDQIWRNFVTLATF